MRLTMRNYDNCILGFQILRKIFPYSLQFQFWLCGKELVFSLFKMSRNQTKARLASQA